MNSQGRTTLKVWLVLVVVFVLGAITGGAFVGGAITGFNFRPMSRPARNERDREEKMRRDLSLTDEQMKSVSTILDETKNEYKALRQELKPRFDEPRLKARGKIRALLTTAQQQKFDAMIAERDAQREGEQKKQR